MKRGAPGDDRGQQARRRGGEGLGDQRGGGGFLGDPGVPRAAFAFKVLCTEGLTSFLLGARGGAKDEIQQETGTKLIFSNKGDYFPGTQYRVLGVYSDEATNIVQALERVLARIVELGDDEKARPPAGGPELLGKEPGEYVFRLCLSRQMAGLLIGSAGENVKRLRRETDAKVFIDNDTVMGHRLVRIIGRPDAIIRCTERVNDIVQRDKDTEEFVQYMRTVNFLAASSMGAWDDDQGGHRDPRDDRRDERRDDRRDRDQRDPTRRGSTGPPPNLDRRTGEALDQLSEDLTLFPPGTAEAAYCISCLIPASRVGALVGRSGDFVRRVEDESRAKVDIEKEAKGDSRQMTCTGGLSDIYKAHAMMMQRLQDIEAKEARDEVAKGRRDDQGDDDGKGRRNPEELMAHIAELQRQLEQAKGSGGGRRRT